jgi:hypothetical protein
MPTDQYPIVGPGRAFSLPSAPLRPDTTSSTIVTHSVGDNAALSEVLDESCLPGFSICCDLLARAAWSHAGRRAGSRHCARRSTSGYRR